MHFHVIDDEKYISDILVNMLQVMGYRSLSFNSSKAYIEYTQSRDFKEPIAAITDINMPGIDGLEMISTIRRDHPDMKFIIITACFELKHPVIHESCMLFSKPIRLQTLQNAISAIMECHNNGIDLNTCPSLGDANLLPENWKCPQCRHAA